MIDKITYAYLCGSVKKGDEDTRDESFFWTNNNEKYLKEGVKDITELKLLNPSKTKISRKDYYANYGCDLHLVSISEVILVDARKEKGVGIGAELMFAQQRGIPVITWSPKNSYYRKDFIPNVFGEDLVNWIHPFIYGLSDYIVEDLDEMVELIKTLATKGALNINKPSANDSIKYFLRKYHAKEY